jgi:hypothetical protein
LRLNDDGIFQDINSCDQYYKDYDRLFTNIYGK